MQHRKGDLATILTALELGSSVAETDNILEAARVETSVFSDLIADRVDLIPGTKGSGKSALYRILVDFLPDILIRDLEKSTVKQLKARAVENGRSLQAESGRPGKAK